METLTESKIEQLQYQQWLWNCVPFLLSEGNGVTICNYSLKSIFSYCSFSHRLEKQVQNCMYIHTHTHIQPQKDVPCNFVGETYHLTLTSFGLFIKFCSLKLFS